MMQARLRGVWTRTVAPVARRAISAGSATGRLVLLAIAASLASGAAAAAAMFSSDSGTLTHRYLPLQAGAAFTYAGYGQASGRSMTYRALGLEVADGKQSMKVQATGDRTWTAWLAEDTAGNVWQLRSLGEEGYDETDYVYLPATLTRGQQFSFEGRWFEVQSVSTDTTTPAGGFAGCLRVREMYEYDDPREETYYAPGYGIVRIVYPDLGSTGFQLTSVTGQSAPPATRFLLTGEVRLEGAGGPGLADVAILLDPPVQAWDAATATDGGFAYANVPAGTYHVVPSFAGYTFEPASRVITLAADTGNVSFFARIAGVPEFLEHPQDRSAVTGQTVEFVVRADGDPEPSLQWQRRVPGSDEWVNLAESAPYAGVTTATLRVGPAAPDMSGDAFRCLATNGKGIATSAPATLSVGPLLQVADVAAGDDHSLFLSADGRLWAMGDNFHGQLGDGSTENRLAPVPVKSGVAACAAGTGYSLFVTNEGELWWRGTGWQSITSQWPTPVAENVVHVSAGARHSLFITSDGALWAIGEHQYLPEDTYWYDPNTPLLVAPDVVTASAAVGYGDHSLFVASDGTLWAWGDNSSGQLGDGTTTWRSFPVKVASGVVRAAAGGDHSLFVKSDGTLWTTGYNYSGQLGDGTTQDRSTPVAVAGNVAGIAASAFHSLFVTTDGTLWAMGDNEHGQLGDGTTTNRSTPVPVASGVACIAAGTYHSLFLKADGTLWAMGWNASGRLGDGTWSDRHTPVQVFVPDTAPPIIGSHPLTQSLNAGEPLTLTVAVEGPGPFAYQWRFDGTDIAGATDASLTLPSAQAFHAGEYVVEVTNASGSTTSGAAMISIDPPGPGEARLLNLSTRALALTGADVMIPGFVISGQGTKQLLIRAVGPRLVDFGVGGVLADPQLVLRRNLDGGGSGIVDLNDDWGTQTTGGDAQAIADAALAFGAFELGADTKSSAILVDVPAGSYGVVSSGVGNSTGVVIAEVYSNPADAATGGAQLVNLSNRGFAGNGGNIMIPGFVVSDEGSRTVLVRVIGPALESYGVAGAMTDPKLIVFQGEVELFSNDDWQSNPDWMRTRQVASLVGAFELPDGSKDAALVVSLQPGAYTVHGLAADGTGTGTILVEIYLVP